jgi:RimJ/RimL family protein N-acetyltransferase
MQTPYLIGTNVYLRPLEKEDAATVQPWINDPEVTRTLLVYRPMSRQAEEEFIANVAKDERSLPLLIALREGDRPIGVVGFKNIDFRNRNAELGIAIGEKDCWGRGYGTEVIRLMVDHAFATLNLHRVWLRVNDNNERAYRCYLRAGFQKEGVLRQEYYREGRYWDVIAMSILRDEWQAGRG